MRHFEMNMVASRYFLAVLQSATAAAIAGRHAPLLAPAPRSRLPFVIEAAMLNALHQQSVIVEEIQPCTVEVGGQSDHFAV